MLSARKKKEDIAIKADYSADLSAANTVMPEETSFVLNLIKDPACLILADGRILKANTALLALLDLPTLETRRHSISDWMHPEDKALLNRKLLLAQTKQQSYQVVVRLRTSNGSFHLYNLDLQTNGEALALIAKSTQKKAEDAGHPAGQSESLLTVSLVYDKDFNLIRYNHSIYQMLGYTEEEFQHKTFAGLLHPQDIPVFSNSIRRLGTDKDKSFTCELRLRHKDQHYVWVQYLVNLQETPGEEPHFTAIVVDISLLKQKEELLLQEQQDMSVFIDRVAHDMKGPLGSLTALHRLVVLEWGHDNKIMEYFNHYHNTVERLNTTVNDLLTLSQVKKATPRIGLVNLRTMVQDCLQSLCHLPDFYKITFTIRIEIKENLYIEERLLQTIIHNLLENAVKYCSETAPKVLICIKHYDNQLHLEVSDNGIGIDEEAQGHIFEMFYRATTRSTGTGLGLYILKNAVDKLGGSVKVRSLPRKGSRFTVILPYKHQLTQHANTFE